MRSLQLKPGDYTYHALMGRMVAAATEPDTGAQNVAAEVWRDCQGTWWVRMGCGYTTTAESEGDAKLWAWDRREHGT